MGIYVKFTKTNHQIWSCHVTLASNSENFYLLLNSILNFRESYQIWGKLAQEQKSYRQKLIGGGKQPPVLIGLRWFIFTWEWSFERANYWSKYDRKLSISLNPVNLILFCKLHQKAQKAF